MKKCAEELQRVKEKLLQTQRERNFYELALQLNEGHISEEKYYSELKNYPEKYVVDYDHVDQYR